jgi:hypothetical protein
MFAIEESHHFPRVHYRDGQPLVTEVMLENQWPEELQESQ